MAETEIPAEQVSADRSGLLRIPAVAGISLAAAGTALWALLEYSATRLGAASPSRVTDGVYVMLVMLQSGYFLSVVPLLRRAARRCLADLQPVLDTSSAELEGIKSRFADTRLPFLKWTLPIGALLTAALQELQLARFSSWFAAPDAALGELMAVLAAWTTWGLGLAAAAMMITDAAAIRRLGLSSVNVDLLRIDRLTAFSRYGLELSAAVVGLMALWAVSLVLISAFIGMGWAETSGYVGLLMVVAYLCLSVAAFVFPQLGVRQQIRRQKELVFNQLTALLPSADQAIAAAGAEPERLAALLSSRNQIQSIPEWPAGQHTRLRLIAYLLIPLLSWSAAALVEEAVSRLLS